MFHLKTMITLRRFDIVERFPIVEDEVTSDYALDLLDFLPPPPVLINDELDTVTDLIQIQRSSFRTRRVELGELHLQKLCDLVTKLELAFERLVSEEKGRKKKINERKFIWTAEIVTPEKDSRFKWTAEKKGLERSYKYTAEIKGKGGAYPPIERTYTVKVSNGDSSSSESEREEKIKKKKYQKVKKGKSVVSNAQMVDIEGPSDHGGIVLRQVRAVLSYNFFNRFLKQCLRSSNYCLIEFKSVN